MHGDQVLFLQGGESLSRGEWLYRDFWDIKQPGVFVGYWAAGKLFGFNEIGVHLFDLLYWLSFAMLVSITWPRLIGEGRSSIWPAITTAGWYWAVTGSVQQTQVEAMVGPLLYLHLWLLRAGVTRTEPKAVAPSATPTMCWVAAGLVATVVLLLKFMFAPLLGVAWLFAVCRVREVGWRSITALTAWYIATALVTFLLAFVPWMVHGDLGLLKWTYFEVPGEMLKEVPRPGYGRLWEAARWFATRYGALAPLAAIGAVRLWRTGRRDWVVFLAAWMAASLTIIVAQRLSWWSYHFMLLAIPLGLFSAEGCVILANGGRRLLMGVLIVLLAPMVIAIGWKWLLLARSNFCLSLADRQAFLLRDPNYKRAKEETAFLHDPESRPGPIYVAGEPIFYRMAIRQPAVAIHGWSLELYPADVRNELTNQLMDAEPAYIFVDRTYYANLIEERYGTLAKWLADRYRVLRESDAGTWYELKT